MDKNADDQNLNQKPDAEEVETVEAVAEIFDASARARDHEEKGESGSAFVINEDGEYEKQTESIDGIDDRSDAESHDYSLDEDRKIDPEKQEAIGITYNEGDKSPLISAIAAGDKAAAIVDMARELGIYVHRDPVLLDELKRLKEGEEVPEQLFGIIAVILSFSYLLQGKTPEIYKRKDGSTAVNIDT